MIGTEWDTLQTFIRRFEDQGLVTRTFRRLDAERQQVILEAIISEAAQAGPTSISIKRVAQRAGVSVGSLYTYFPNRDGMLEFAIQLCAQYFCELLDSYRPMLAEMPLKEALAGYLLGGIEWSRTQMGLLQLYARAAYQGDAALADKLVLPIAETLRRTLLDILTQASRRGELAENLDLEAVSRLLHGLTIVLADSQLLPYLNHYFQVTGEEVSFERVMEAFIKLVEKGIGK